MALVPVITPFTGNGGEGVNSVEVTLPRLPQANESVTVELSFFNNEGAGPLTLLDNHGNIWDVETHVGIDANTGSWWRKLSALCKAPALGTDPSFTITIIAPDNTWGIFTGTASIWPAVLTRVSKISASAQAVTSATSVTNTTPVPPAVPAIAISILSVSKLVAGITAPSGWAVGRIEQNWSGGPTPFGMAYREVVSLAAATATWSFSPADQAAALTSLFTYGTGGGGGGSSGGVPRQKVCSAPPLRANARYFDPINGSPGNTGLSWASPWKRLGDKVGSIPADCDVWIEDPPPTLVDIGRQYLASADGVLPNKISIRTRTFQSGFYKSAGSWEGDLLVFDAGSFDDVVIFGLGDKDSGDPSGNGWVTFGGNCKGLNIIGCQAVNYGNGVPSRQDHFLYVKGGATYNTAPRQGKVSFCSVRCNRQDLGCGLLHAYSSGGNVYGIHDYDFEDCDLDLDGAAWGVLIQAAYAPGSPANLNFRRCYFRMKFPTSYSDGQTPSAAIFRFFGSEGAGPTGGVDASAVIEDSLLAIVGGPGDVFYKDAGTSHAPTIRRNTIYNGGSGQIASGLTIDGTNTILTDISQVPEPWTVLPPGSSTTTSTITGNGELPTTYPISSASFSPNTANQAAGATATYVPRDQNGLSLWGATVDFDLPSKASVPSGFTTPASGEIPVTIAADATGQVKVRARITDPTNGPIVAELTISIGSTKPLAPSGLSATALSSSAVRLTFMDNATDETGTLVQRRLGSSGAWTTITTIAATADAGARTYDDATVSPGTYQYRLIASGASGDSDPSNVVTVVVPVPVVDPEPTIAITTGVAIVAAPGYVALIATVTNTQQVQFYRRQGSVDTPVGSPVLSPYVQSVPFQSAAENGTYTYWARATSATGKTADSALATLTVNIPATQQKPNAPSDLRLYQRSSTSLIFRFTSNSTNETAFLPEIQQVGGAFVSLPALAAGETQFSVEGLLANQTFVARVRAQNAAGFSGYATSTVVSTLPPPSTGLGSVVPSVTVLAGAPGETVEFFYTTTDGNGSGRPGVTVILTPSNPAAATLSALQAVSDAQGRAVFTLTHGPDVGECTFTGQATDGSTSLLNIAAVSVVTMPAFTPKLIEALKAATPDPKFPEERLLYVFDLRDGSGNEAALGDDEQIVGTPVIQVVPVGPPSVDPMASDMLFGPAMVAGQFVIQYIKSGLPGLSYVARCYVTTSLGRKITAELRLRVYSGSGRRAERL